LRKEAFIPGGVTLKGTILNSVTKNPVKAVMLLDDPQSKKESLKKTYNTGEVDDNGNFQFNVKDTGKYQFKVVNVGYKDIVFDLIITSSFISVTDQETGEGLTRYFEEDEAMEIDFPVNLIPDGYIKGEVINKVEGTPYKFIEVGLVEGGETVITGEEGEFFFKPIVLDKAGMVYVYAKPDKCTKVTEPIYLSYEFPDNVTDQYMIYKDSNKTPLSSAGDYDLILKIDPPGLVLSGQVIQSYDDAPLDNVTIEYDHFLRKDAFITTTPGDGSFSIPLDSPADWESPEMSFTLRLTRDNFYPEDYLFTIKELSKDSGQYKIYDKSDEEYGCTVTMDNFYGKWEGQAVSTVVAQSDDYFCGTARVNILVEDGDVRGTALVNKDYLLKVSGSVTKEGVIEAGMAQGSENVANFKATLKTDNKGSGTWSDSFGCRGTLTLEKQF